MDQRSDKQATEAIAEVQSKKGAFHHGSPSVDVQTWQKKGMQETASE